jgi:hypothetical protein
MSGDRQPSARRPCEWTAIDCSTRLHRHADVRLLRERVQAVVVGDGDLLLRVARRWVSQAQSAQFVIGGWAFTLWPSVQTYSSTSVSGSSVIVVLKPNGRV